MKFHKIDSVLEFDRKFYGMIPLDSVIWSNDDRSCFIVMGRHLKEWAVGSVVGLQSVAFYIRSAGHIWFKTFPCKDDGVASFIIQELRYIVGEYDCSWDQHDQQEIKLKVVELLQQLCPLIGLYEFHQFKERQRDDI